jgi:hypothetical protein
MKQTAVEWLENKFKEELILINSANGYNICVRVEKFDELVEQAKEMEKQIMLEFADDYGTYLLKGGTMSAGTYNETYNK